METKAEPTYLVTGGAGFIGCNFVRHVLATTDARIITLDALTYAGSRANLADLPAPERHTFVEGDIRDRELVEKLIGRHAVNVIVHFAAESHVDRSISGPAAFIDTNVVGTLTLLEAARAAWARDGGWRAGVRFHHVSTDEVYGSLGPDDPAFSEVTPYAPNSPYAASKAGSDHLVRSYGHTYGLPFTISNCSNNYGPYQFPEKLIPLMVFNAMEGRSLPVYGDGRQVRDWLYVNDHCEAIARIIEQGATGRTYNIGGGNQPANIEIVETICGLMDERFPDSKHRPHENLIRFVQDRPGHDRRYAMDTRRIEAELGWRPRHDLQQGLRDTIDWYLSNEAWLAAIRERTDYQGWMKQNYAGRAEAK